MNQLSVWEGRGGRGGQTSQGLRKSLPWVWRWVVVPFPETGQDLGGSNDFRFLGVLRFRHLDIQDVQLELFTGKWELSSVEGG